MIENNYIKKIINEKNIKKIKNEKEHIKNIISEYYKIISFNNNNNIETKILLKNIKNEEKDLAYLKKELYNILDK